MEGRRYEPVRHVGETEVDVVCGKCFRYCGLEGTLMMFGDAYIILAYFYATERQMKAWKASGGFYNCLS